jgi:hypothetical protein
MDMHSLKLAFQYSQIWGPKIWKINYRYILVFTRVKNWSNVCYNVRYNVQRDF